MKSAPGSSRSPNQVCADVAVGLLGLVGVGAALVSIGVITVVTYQVIVICDPSLGGGRDLGDYGIAGVVGLATGFGITGIALAATLRCNRNKSDYPKIIGMSAVMMGLAVIAGVALAVMEASKA